MRFIVGASVISTILTLSSAAAINRRPASKNSPAIPVQQFDSNLGSGDTFLKPIKLDTFRSAANLHVRDAVDFTRLDLASQAELIFGAPGDNGNILLANMTLYAPDGQQIVMMECFEGLTTAVDCNGDDGLMSLTFKSEDAFNAAVQKWSHINEKDEDSFLLIANHDGCGPEDQRQAYTYISPEPYLIWGAANFVSSISKVTNDEAGLVTTLAAKKAPWSEIAGTFDMNFGSAIVTPGAIRRLLARGFFDDIKDKAGDLVDKAGDFAGGFVDGAKDLGGDIADGAGKAAGGVVDGAKDLAGDIANGAGKAAGGVVDGAQDAVGAIGDAVSDVVEDIGNTKLDKEVTFDVTIGTPGQRFNVLKDPIR